MASWGRAPSPSRWCMTACPDPAAHSPSPSASPSEFSWNVEHTVKAIKQDHHIDTWDAVLIDGSVATNQSVIGAELQRDLRRARLVVFDGTNNFGTYENHDRLLKDPEYELVAHNPGLRNGYAIFKRIVSAPTMKEIVAL